MAEELDVKQVEAAERRRLLEELEKASAAEQKEIKRSTEVEDPEALSGLYHQTVGLPREQEAEKPGSLLAPPTPSAPIVRITATDIKAMKVTTAAASSINIFELDKWLVRIWPRMCEYFATLFAPRLEKQKPKKCDPSGHTCLHCGATFSVKPQPVPQPAQSPQPTAATPAAAGKKS